MYNDKYRYLTLSLLFAVMALTREFYFFHRGGLHVDETLSFVLSSYSDFGWTSIFNELNKISGIEVQRKILFSSSSISDALKDIVSLWKDNRDTPHSNLYYSFLRLWFVGVDVNGRYGFASQWAMQLNILLFLISYIFICKTVKLFTPSLLACVLCLSAIFMNNISLSNSIFLRPYQLQETLLCIYTYFSFRLIALNQLNLLSAITYSFATAFAILSGYFAVFYVSGVALATAVVAFISNKDNLKKAFIFSIGYIFLTSIFTFAIYPPYFFVNGNRQNEAMHKVGNLLENAFASIQSFNHSMFLIYGLYVSVILTALFFIASLTNGKLKKLDYYALFIGCYGLLWIFIVMMLSPYKGELRYIYPAVFISCVFYIYSYKLLSGLSKYLSNAVTAFSIFAIVICHYVFINPEYQNGGMESQCAMIKPGAAIITNEPWKLTYLSQCLSRHELYYISSTINASEISAVNPEYIITDKSVNFGGYVNSGKKIMSYFSIYQK